jgi:DNA (cytosine-5)-methyltransferase 1
MAAFSEDVGSPCRDLLTQKFDGHRNVCARMESVMTGLSLFSGIGGLDIAFERAGGHIVAMCERDAFCQAILRKRWPGIPIFDDVRELTGKRVMEVICNEKGEEKCYIDVIYGGFPCQPYSLCGQRKAKDDERHLWPECARLVREIKPVWCIFENVPGILSLVADDVCEDLERQGYAVGIFCYEAAAVAPLNLRSGAPHRRMRVFFVAHTQSRRPKSRERRPRSGSEKTGEKANHQASGSGQSPSAVSHSGRRVLQRSAVPGKVR